MEKVYQNPEQSQGKTKSSPPASENPTLTAALDYARHGLAVVALHWPVGDGCSCKHKEKCGTPGKHPRWNKDDLPNGANSATTDEKIIRRWWKRWPQANVGIATGKISGIIVVDIDPRHGGDKSLKKLPGNLPLTLTTRTGGKGEHYYLKYPDNGIEIPNDQDFAGFPGIDLKSNGGFVVAPPSHHISGEDYYWKINLDHPIAPTQNWLLELIKKEDTPERKSAPEGEVIPEGKRVKTLVSMAGTMRRRGMNEPAILAGLIGINEYQCESPLPDSKIQDIARSCGRYASGDITGAPGPPQWIPAEEEAYVKSEQEAKQDETQELPPDRHGPPPPPTFPEIISAADLENLVFPEIEWMVQGMVPMGFGLLSARPKKGKTYLALNLGAAKAAGGCALGKNELRMDPGLVLYIAYEDKKRRVRTRLKTIMQGEPFPQRLYVAETWSRLPDGGLDRMDSWLTANPDAKLVIIDTLGRFKPRKRPRQDDYEMDLATGAALADLAHKHNICILGIYHNRKTESDDPLDDVHGSTGMTAAADFIMVLRRGRGQADATLFVSGRDVEEQELALKFHPGEGTWELMGDAAEYAKSQERIEIIQLLRGKGPKTPKELAEITGKKYNNIKCLLLKMAKDQEVKSVGGTYEVIKK